MVDTVSYLHKVTQENKNVLVEGANATMLDIDFGIYQTFSFHLSFHENGGLLPLPNNGHFSVALPQK